MPSYLITGVSRGIGFQFLDTLSSNPNNTIIGIVRNVPETEAKIASWNRNNIHIVPGDLDNYESLEEAVESTTKITGGSLDYLIANTAYLPYKGYDSLSELGTDPVELERNMLVSFKINVVAQTHLINLAMPLILKGNVKKVIAISSGIADTELTAKFDIYEAGPYAISKIALNMVIAKFQAEYNSAGVLFLAVCPGVVDTEQHGKLSLEDAAKMVIQGAKFRKFAPHFKGPATTEDAVRDVLSVIEKASVKNGDGGAFLSHFGNKQWL